MFRMTCRCIVLSLVLGFAPAQAQDPFYFIAKVAPNLSPGSVLLRWDLAEGGDLPPDIQQFRLMRNGELIAQRPATALMTPDQINALYRLPGARRHYLDTLSALKQVARDDMAVAEFPVEAFASAVSTQLQRDPTWALLAARRDPIIALARNRAFLDTPSSGLHRYELLAENAAGVTRRVGLVELDTRENRQVLPPQAFRQAVQGECDALEAGRDHASVGLTWSAAGGDAVADRLATQLFTAGYWLYRSSENLSPTAALVARDLAAEAQGQVPGPDGKLVFAGLEPASDILLSIDGDPTGAAVYVETRQELERVGMRPGDRRAYYLVAQDFTGALGPTVGALVTVGDASRPPPPWDVNVYADSASDELELRWSNINYDSYVNLFVGRNRICNAADAQTSGRLRMVGPNEICETGVPREVRLDVAGYRVYRFDNFEAASVFADHDGDGVSDLDERRAIAAGNLAAGAQCDAARKPATASDRKVADSVSVPPSVPVSVLPNSPYPVARFRDNAPSQAKGEVSWYVIHSVTTDGRVSQPSRPVRAIFPDRELPESPQVDVFQRDTSTACNECALDVRDAAAPWQFNDAIKTDPNIQIECRLPQGRLPATDVRPVGSLQNSQGDYCAPFAAGQVCAEVVLRYNASSKPGPSNCAVLVPETVDFCRRGEVVLVGKGCGRTRVMPGDSVVGDAIAEVEGPEGTCVSLWQRIADVDTRVATSCDILDDNRLTFTIENDTFCGYALAHDANNNVSPRTTVGCVVARDEDFTQPPPPQPLTLSYFGDLADLRWRLPPETVAVTLIELRREADGRTVLQGVPKGDVATGEDEQADLPLPAPLGGSERWCARLRTVLPAPAGGVAAQSDWTAPVCAERDAASPPPPYLAWPVVPAAPQGAPFVVEVAQAQGLAQRLIALGLLTNIGDAQCTLATVPAEIKGQLDTQTLCRVEIQDQFTRLLTEWSRFIVYRQSRSPEGREGPYLQVSPLIDRVHWEAPVDLASGRFALLNDPFIKLRRPTSGNQRQVVFEDRYPLFQNHEVRYQIVILDAQNRIQAWRQSPWTATAVEGTP